MGGGVEDPEGHGSVTRSRGGAVEVERKDIELDFDEREAEYEEVGPWVGGGDVDVRVVRGREVVVEEGPVDVREVVCEGSVRWRVVFVGEGGGVEDSPLQWRWGCRRTCRVCARCHRR